MNPLLRMMLRPVPIVAAGVMACTFFACGGGNPVTPPPPPVTPSLTGVAVTPSSVVGGNTAQGTVTLSAAPTAGTVVSLQSNSAAAVVPASGVTVNSGSTSATFSVSTTTVAASTAATISASLNGSSQTTTLTVTPPALTASFTVVSATKGADACVLKTDRTLDCAFDGSRSTGAGQWLWHYEIGKNSIDLPAATSPTVPNPGTNGCGLFAGETGGSPTSLQMIVRLTVKDASGNQSAEATNRNVSVFPSSNGACGGF